MSLLVIYPLNVASNYCPWVNEADKEFFFKNGVLCFGIKQVQFGDENFDGFGCDLLRKKVSKSDHSTV